MTLAAAWPAESRSPVVALAMLVVVISGALSLTLWRVPALT